MLSAAGLSCAVCDAELELEPHAARHRTQERAATTGGLALIGVMRCLPMVVTTMLFVPLCVAGKRVLWHAAAEKPSARVNLPKHLVADATVRGASEQARVPDDARVEIGHPTRLRTNPHVSSNLIASSRSLMRPEEGAELIGRCRFVGQASDGQACATAPARRKSST